MVDGYCKVYFWFYVFFFVSEECMVIIRNKNWEEVSKFKIRKSEYKYFIYKFEFVKDVRIKEFLIKLIRYYNKKYSYFLYRILIFNILFFILWFFLRSNINFIV